MPNFEKTGERNGVSRYLLRSNGLEVLLKEDHATPVAAFLVLYRVGSRNEAVGYTGATHLLEHMMFKGTPDMHVSCGTQVAALLERVGADFNATTWYDRTNYFETVPSDQLELAMRVEADRMRNSLIDDADRQSEMTVVRNELERGENDPLAVLDIQCHAAAFREHPYHHPTIGWRADVEGVPTSRLKEFYDTFYWPNNATVVVAGDIDPDQTLALVDRYFGVIPASPDPIPLVYTIEPEQQGERRLVVRRSGHDGIVMVNFPGPIAASPDTAALAVVETLLGTGRSSRLYRDLVDTQLASEVAASVERFHDPGLFQVHAHVLPGVAHGTVERAILAALERLRDEPVGEAELEKARRIVLTRLVFDREGSANFAYEMSEAVSSADWSWFFDYPEMVEGVTAEAIQRVARTYFRRNRLTVGWFVSIDPDSAPDDEALVEELQPAAPPPPRSEPPALSTSSAAPTVAPPPVTGRRSTAPAGADTRGFAERTVSARLASGATVLVLENHSDPTVALHARIRAGTWFANRDLLLADVTARMLRRGTKYRDAFRFAESVESLGAHLDVESGPFTVDVWGHALSQDAPVVLEAIAEMLREPVFPESELGKVKAELAAELRQRRDSTRARALDRLTQLVLPRSNPFHCPPVEELLARLEAITVDDVRSNYDAHYNGGALLLAVAGHVGATAVDAHALSLFGDWEGPRPVDVDDPVTVPGPGTRDTVRMRDKANADVIIGLPGTLRRHDPDYMAATIGNAILGQSTLSSRFGLRVRDREGLTYGINSRFHGASLTDGLWYVGLSVEPGSVERAIVSTLDELTRALDEGVTEDEVADYKTNFSGSFKVSLATNAGIADTLAEAEFYGFGARYLDEYPEIVSAITRDGVDAALRAHIDPDRVTTVVAGEIEPAR